MDVDDYANLLDVTEYFQLNIIEKMLNLVTIFAKNDVGSIKYKNHFEEDVPLYMPYDDNKYCKLRLFLR